MLIYGADSTLVSLKGATINAPELAVIDAPMPGTWFVLVRGVELYRPDIFKLYLTTE